MIEADQVLCFGKLALTVAIPRPQVIAKWEIGEQDRGAWNVGRRAGYLLGGFLVGVECRGVEALGLLRNSYHVDPVHSWLLLLVITLANYRYSLIPGYY